MRLTKCASLTEKKEKRRKKKWKRGPSPAAEKVGTRKKHGLHSSIRGGKKGGTLAACTRATEGQGGKVKGNLVFLCHSKSQVKNIYMKEGSGKGGISTFFFKLTG